jgi:RimJ/RimL family protein N-acetyltransferase
MRLRPLARADLDAVRILRNHSRAAFFDSSEISPDRHLAWFERLPMKPVSFFVIEDDDIVVGTISLTDAAEGREVGNLTLAPSYRGRGLMRQAIAQLTTAPGRYFAELRPDNEPSRRVFLSAGFVEQPHGQILRAWKTVIG